MEWPAAGLSWLAAGALGAVVPGRASRRLASARQKRVATLLKLGAAALLVAVAPAQRLLL